MDKVFVECEKELEECPIFKEDIESISIFGNKIK